MEANPNLDCTHGWIFLINQSFISSFDRTNGKLGNSPDMVSILLLNTISDLGRSKILHQSEQDPMNCNYGLQE
jgi:hypothetical protein